MTAAKLTVFAFLILSTAVAWAGAGDKFSSVHDMPVVETEGVVIQWLEAKGFTVSRFSRDDLHVRIVAVKGAIVLNIALKPQSPLATHVLIDPESKIAQSAATQLAGFLEGYINLPNQSAAKQSFEVPAIAENLQGAIVCLYADNKGREYQFSGFIIDTQGLIVSTAHDLHLDQPVSVLYRNGKEKDGRVVRIDPRRDLSVIKTSGPLPKAVPLRNGRFLLRNGDPLFSITCPSRNYSGVQTGFVDGPPRRVGGFPLWQVQMHVDPGSSGSPVFDDQGRLAAIVKGRFRGTDSIGFLIPFETLLHFLEKY